MEKLKVYIIFFILISGFFLSLFDLNSTIVKTLYSHANKIPDEFSAAKMSLADLDRARNVNKKIRNSFAGLRSEQYDERKLEIDKLEREKSPNSRIAEEFIYANFELKDADIDSKYFFDLSTPSNLEKIKKRKFQNEMKKFRVQFRIKVDGKDAYYGSENPYCIIQTSFECNEKFPAKYFEQYFGRNPASANIR